MKHTLKQVFSSTRFVIGFAIFMFILLTVIIYPALCKSRSAGASSVRGLSSSPGSTSTFMTALVPMPYTLKLEDAAAKRIAGKLGDEERLAIGNGLSLMAFLKTRSTVADTEKLLDQWVNNYDPTEKHPSG